METKAKGVGEEGWIAWGLSGSHRSYRLCLVEERRGDKTLHVSVCERMNWEWLFARCCLV